MKMTEYDRKLLAQQAHYARFMHAHRDDDKTPPLDDSNEAWQHRSDVAARPEEIFGAKS